MGTTNLSLEQGLQASNVAFQVGYQNGFVGQTLPGAYTIYEDVQTTDAEWTYLEMTSNFPQMREWIGARRAQYFRQYEQQIKMKTYEVMVEVQRKSLQYRDKLGLVANSISRFLDQERAAFDRTAHQSWLSAAGVGPTGYDGVALYSTAHPQSGTGSNQSNLAAAAVLSTTTLETGIATMTSNVLENGEPAGFRPNILLGGPKLQRRMELLVGKERVILIDAAGKMDPASAGVAAGVAANPFSGALTAIVDNRRIGLVAGTDVSYFWDLIDTTRAGIRPMIKLVGMAPTPGHQDQPNDPVRFNKDMVQYGLTGDWVDDAGFWMSGYRGTGTS